MSYTYEELRAVAVNILAGRIRSRSLIHEPGQKEHLRVAVMEHLVPGYDSYSDRYSAQGSDGLLFDEVFWDLFRQGLITPGMDPANPDFPFFRVSSFGKKVLAQSDPYFFHDVSSYEAALRREIPDIDDVTLLYAKEAMQAYMSGCLLSSTVMVGVAVEGAFLSLIDAIEADATWAPVFKNVFEQRTILQRLNKFLGVAAQSLMKELPSELKENFDTDFTGVLNMIRNYRNQSGHPSGKILPREECFILLRLFIPYCRKLHDLIAFFK